MSGTSTGIVLDGDLRADGTIALDTYPPLHLSFAALAGPYLSAYDDVGEFVREPNDRESKPCHLRL